MKTKSFLFILAAALLLSFTVITQQPKEITATAKTSAAKAQNAPESGFALEDKNQW